MLLRLKEDYDGAEPAASSVAALNLLTLAHLTGDAAIDEQVRADAAIGSFAAAQLGRAVPMMLAALSTYHAGMTQVVIVGDPRGRGHRGAARGAAARVYLPDGVRRAGDAARTATRWRECCPGPSR